ncbi:DUF3000 domain-containing protein [Longispora albida]|uniref:DUF3000 domain-containing protein n=1 Tax=Longispora albida TaxID=203523 RepID=UPI0003734089|nr:DUF3000 domain-containing protein [Longispora albida]
MAQTTALPDPFRRAVEGLRAVHPRAEILLEEIVAPKKLAPYAFALSATVLRKDEEVATGRLVLLYDPAGHPAWEGQLRLVSYVSADVEPEIAADVLLPEVSWSWLIDALTAAGAGHVAAGGTVTQTLSTRFGDLAGEPPAADVELRASWTPLDPDGLASHLEAWCVLLASTAGLPPPGVASLR